MPQELHVPSNISGWFASILDSATEAIISVDADQRIVLFNQAAVDIFQYEAEEVIGQPVHMLLPERFHGRHRDDLERFAEGDRRPRRMASGRTVLGRRKSGAEFPAEASISRVDDEHGTVLTVILRDVSEREAAIRRLADSEAWFRLLVDKFPGFVYTMELSAEPGNDGLPLPSITFASERSRALLGKPPDALYGDFSTFLESIHPDAREEILSLHQDCLATGKTIDTTVRLLDDEGDIKIAINRATRSLVLDSETGSERAILQGVMIDVTERERLQQKLVQSERMAEAGRLAAIVAHEINSPITAIRGCFEVLLSRAELDEAMREYAETAHEEAKRVATLAMQLRDYSRPAHDTRRPLQVNELVMDISNMIGHELRKHGISVERDLEEQLPPVYGDTHELKQVIWNLVANAWDAMSEGGLLLIRTRSNGTPARPIVTVEVVDTGKGIPPEIRNKIFNMFFTTKENTHSGGGAGLGLAISQKIVERHHGRIEFDSAVGEGATFRIVLPGISMEGV